MPKIQGYEDQIGAQGGITTRASATDFGAQVGAGMQQLGAGIEAVGDTIFKGVETQDVTNVHVQMAKARDEWTQELQNRKNSATPGDDTFAPTVMRDMEGWVAKAAESAKTTKGRRLYETMGANLVSEFGQRAIQIQADLAAQDAINKYDLLKSSLGSVAYNDFSQAESAHAQAVAAIDDPGGIFAKVPAPVRDKFKQQIQEDLNFAAGRGFVRQGDGAAKLLGSIAPDIMAQYKPFDHLMKVGAAPGARVNITPETMAKAPEIAPMAAEAGLNTNIIMAQTDMAPGQDPVAAMPKFVRQYAGDYTKALAAFQMGDEAFKAHLIEHGATWQENLPEATATYINTVLEKAGQIPPVDGPGEDAPTPEVVEPRAAAATGLPFFRGLNWEQQDALVKESIQIQDMRLRMGRAAREEAKYQKEEAQNTEMDSVLRQVVENKTTYAKILDNKILDWNQKKLMGDYLQRLQDERTARAEGQSNPSEVRRLMLRIHAADADPTKTYNMEPIMESFRRGGINTREFMLLRGELEQMKDGSSSGFAKRLHTFREAVYTGFVQSIQGSAQKDKAVAAWYAFWDDLDQKVAAKRKANEDPSSLLDPNSKDFVGGRDRLRTFMSSPQAVLEDGARRVAEAEATRIPVGRDKVKAGELYKDDKGNVLRRKD